MEDVTINSTYSAGIELSSYHTEPFNKPLYTYTDIEKLYYLNTKLIENNFFYDKFYNKIYHKFYYNKIKKFK